MHKLIKGILIGLIGMSFAHIAQADIIALLGDGEWTTATIWNPNTVGGPSTGDVVRVRNSKTVTVNTAVEIGQLDLASSSDGNVIISASGGLNVTTNFNMTDATSSGSLSIQSGGTLDVGNNFVMGNNAGTGTMTIEWILDATGFTGGITAPGSALRRDNTAFVVDGSAFNGGVNQTFTLLSATILSGSTVTDITFNSFAAQYSPQLIQNVGTDTITLFIGQAVPEPSSLGLLGLGGAMLMVIRWCREWR